MVTPPGSRSFLDALAAYIARGFGRRIVSIYHLDQVDDPMDLLDTCDQCLCDLIRMCHLAPSPSFSFLTPRETYRTPVSGACQLAKCALQCAKMYGIGGGTTRSHVGMGLRCAAGSDLC